MAQLRVPVFFDISRYLTDKYFEIVWGCSFTDKIPNWTKTRIGQNPKLDKIPNGQNPEWTKSRMTKSQIGQNPKWIKSRIGQKIGQRIGQNNWGFCPFGILSILDFVQFEILSIRDLVQFGILSIRDLVHSGFCPIRDFVQFGILFSSGFCPIRDIVFRDFVQDPGVPPPQRLPQMDPPKNQFFERLKLRVPVFYDIRRYLTDKYVDSTFLEVPHLDIFE